MSSDPAHIVLTEKRWAAFLNSQELFLRSPIEGIDLFSRPSLDPSEVRDIDLLLSPQGKQMEHLMVEAISRSDRYELIVHGLQVPDTGRTIGELDFLILDKQFDEVIHMEMVYKYYIHDQDEGEGPYGSWIGPGRKDRLTWKLAHLTDHQFPLLHHPMTLPLLAQYGIEPSKVRQELCFLAELYMPFSKRVEVAESMNDEAIEGEWMPLERFIDLDTQGVKAHCPIKADWLMDYDESLAIPLADIQEEVIKTVRKGRAVLLFLCENGVEKKQFITAT